MIKRCEQCQIAYINGVRCHETGCPEAWREEDRECKWCGSTFTPENRHQGFCEDSCARSWAGVPNESEDNDEAD